MDFLAFFRIWIRFDRDTKMFKFAPLSFLIRSPVVFLRRLVVYDRFGAFRHKDRKARRDAKTLRVTSRLRGEKGRTCGLLI